MDEVIARIKELVTQFYPTILADLSISEDQLDLYTEEVIERFLAFTKRDQLVPQYERDLVRYPDETDCFWDDYYFPIPKNLEKVLARVVGNSARTVVSQNQGEMEATSLSDNGQSVTYGDKLQSFFSSSDDARIFADSYTLLSSYRIPKVASY